VPGVNESPTERCDVVPHSNHRSVGETSEVKGQEPRAGRQGGGHRVEQWRERPLERVWKQEKTEVEVEVEVKVEVQDKTRVRTQASTQREIGLPVLPGELRRVLRETQPHLRREAMVASGARRPLLLFDSTPGVLHN